jgi:hypothetical protein
MVSTEKTFRSRRFGWQFFISFLLLLPVLLREVLTVLDREYRDDMGHGECWYRCYLEVSDEDKMCGDEQ